MERQVITFASVDLAQQLVAGVPACARAGLLAAQGMRARGAAVLAIPGGRLTDPHACRELERLCLDGYALIDSRELTASDICRSGELLITAAIAASRDRAVLEGTPQSIAEFYRARSVEQLRDDLRRASWGFVRATGKSGDGIVSRSINRHISMRISAALLSFRWIRPGHATILTAIVAAAMFVAMLSGSFEGLVLGAILFQMASIVDGVDGEIARATGRTSARGAMLDTITDGFTNVGFIVGLAVNLTMRDVYLALEIGLIGSASLALGCTILAIQALRHGEVVTFDAVGIWMKRQPGWARRVLVAITKRDFFALASMVLILMSLDREMLLILSGSCTSWLIFVVYVSAQSNTDDVTV